MSNDEVPLTFGEWLDDNLRARKLSRERFARAIGYSLGSVESWIAGRRDPSERACFAIADALGIDRNEVLRRAGRPPEERESVSRVNEEPPAYDSDDLREVMQEMTEAIRLSAERIAGLEAQIERLLKDREDGQG